MAEKEEDMVVVEVLLMVLFEAFGRVIYCFLVKFTDEKELVTDRRPINGPTDRQTLLQRCVDAS